jgi:hypothetical protein
MIIRRAFLIALLFALIAPASAAFASAASGDGVWTGLWGGKDDTAIVIKDNKVVRYTYKGATQPVETIKADDKQISFGTKLFTITMMRVGDTSASAKSKRPMGQASVDLTRQ